MEYAKLIDGVIVYAPRKIGDGNIVIYNPPAEMLEELGYLPIEYTEQPEVPEGYELQMGWEIQNDVIVQTWEIIKQDPSAEEVLSIILGGEE